MSTSGAPSRIDKNDLDIEFSQPNGEYETGERVGGAVVIYNESPMEVTGLKVTLFLKMVAKLLNDSGEEYVSKKTHAFKTIDLHSELFGDSKHHTKVLPVGPNYIPFSFPPLTVYYTSSINYIDEDDYYNRSFFIRTELKTKSGAVIKKDENFVVSRSKLDKNTEAKKWQTKTSWKYVSLNMKKATMTVTVPTAFSFQEHKIPIHLSITNESKHPKLIIRSRILRTFQLPMEKTFKGETEVHNENIEEVDISNGEIFHYLKLTFTNLATFSCPLLMQTFRIEVELETLNGKMKVDFPVISGFWENGPVREKAPYDKSTVTTEDTKTAININPADSASSLTEKRSSPNFATNLYPTLSNQTEPTAPPMESAPPTYEEAMQESSPSTYPSLCSYPITNHMWAKRSYVGVGKNELSFQCAQLFTNVHASDEPGWVIGTMIGQTGLIPHMYLMPDWSSGKSTH